MGYFIEVIGIIAGILIFGAMILKRLVAIKLFLLGGSVLFLIYGLIQSLLAIIIVNCVGTCIGIYGLIKAIKYERACSTMDSATDL